jgi:hypothetical protein
MRKRKVCLKSISARFPNGGIPRDPNGSARAAMHQKFREGADLGRLESLGVEFRQDFPDVVVMTRRGEIVSPLALQNMK